MSSNPESYARVSKDSILKDIDFVDERIATVCAANTLRNVLSVYEQYKNRKASWRTLWCKPTVKPFGEWLEGILDEFHNSDIWLCHKTTWDYCLDNKCYDGLCKVLKVLATNSVDYILVCDSDMMMFNDVKKKSMEFEKSQEYLRSRVETAEFLTIWNPRSLNEIKV